MLFTGTMTDSVRNTTDEYTERLEPGDVIVANDPYRTGTHVNDLLFCRPVYDGARLAGFVNLKAHQLDMGGVAPGGFSLTKHNVYETGLVVSPRSTVAASWCARPEPHLRQRPLWRDPVPGMGGDDLRGPDTR